MDTDHVKEISPSIEIDLNYPIELNHASRPKNSAVSSSNRPRYRDSQVRKDLELLLDHPGTTNEQLHHLIDEREDCSDGRDHLSPSKNGGSSDFLMDELTVGIAGSMHPDSSREVFSDGLPDISVDCGRTVAPNESLQDLMAPFMDEERFSADGYTGFAANFQRQMAFSGDLSELPEIEKSDENGYSGSCATGLLVQQPDDLNIVGPLPPFMEKLDRDARSVCMAPLVDPPAAHLHSGNDQGDDVKGYLNAETSEFGSEVKRNQKVPGCEVFANDIRCGELAHSKGSPLLYYIEYTDHEAKEQNGADHPSKILNRVIPGEPRLHVGVHDNHNESKGTADGVPNSDRSFENIVRGIHEAVDSDSMDCFKITDGNASLATKAGDHWKCAGSGAFSRTDDVSMHAFREYDASDASFLSIRCSSELPEVNNIVKERGDVRADPLNPRRSQNDKIIVDAQLAQPSLMFASPSSQNADLVVDSDDNGQTDILGHEVESQRHYDITTDGRSSGFQVYPTPKMADADGTKTYYHVGEGNAGDGSADSLPSRNFHADSGSALPVAYDSVLNECSGAFLGERESLPFSTLMSMADTSNATAPLRRANSICECVAGKSEVAVEHLCSECRKKLEAYVGGIGRRLDGNCLTETPLVASYKDISMAFDQSWRTSNEIYKKLVDCEKTLIGVHKSVELEREHARLTKLKILMSKKVQNLRSTCFLNRVFYIFVIDNIGVINGCRLGRTAGSDISTREINTAMGDLACLCTYLKKIFLPDSDIRFSLLGSSSSIVAGTNEPLPLYLVDSLLSNYFHGIKLNQGFALLLDFYRALADHITKVTGVAEPILTDKSSVGGVPISYSHADEESWTTAMRFLMLNFKWLIAMASQNHGPIP